MTEERCDSAGGELAPGAWLQDAVIVLLAEGVSNNSVEEVWRILERGLHC